MLYRIAAEQVHAEAAAETRWIAGGSGRLLLGLVRGETRQLIGDAWRCGRRSDERQLTTEDYIRLALSWILVAREQGQQRERKKEGEAIGTLQHASMPARQYARWRG